MRLAYLLFAFSLLGSSNGCSKPHPKDGDAADGKLSDRANSEAAQLELQINSELKALHDHAWAGSYYQGDGLGANASLILAPTKGYLFEWHGCMGLYDRNYGKVVVKRQRLQLSFRYPNIREGFQGIAEEFLPVAWGNRKYLIPSDDIIGFCNDINSGIEPRRQLRGGYLIRDGDEEKDVAGLPNLPAKFKPYLLDHPLETEILEVGKKTIYPSICEWNFVDTNVVLGIGKADGILPGMELHVVEPDHVMQSVKVRTVDNDKCTGVMTQIEDDAVAIEAGWKLSTRLRWN